METFLTSCVFPPMLWSSCWDFSTLSNCYDNRSKKLFLDEKSFVFCHTSRQVTSTKNKYAPMHIVVTLMTRNDEIIMFFTKVWRLLNYYEWTVFFNTFNKHNYLLLKAGVLYFFCPFTNKNKIALKMNLYTQIVLLTCQIVHCV